MMLSQNRKFINRKDRKVVFIYILVLRPLLLLSALCG